VVPVTCNIQVDDGNLVRSNAEQDAKEDYPLGSRHTILENKTTKHCATLKEGRNLAIVGVTFFAAAAAVLLTWMGVTMAQLIASSKTTEIVARQVPRLPRSRSTSTATATATATAMPAPPPGKFDIFRSQL
jgi:hypothetical protein